MSDVPDIGRDLLAERLAWEAANPRPETLRRVERTIVRALNAAGFGRQYQVTRDGGFEIAVDDLLIRVEHDPTAEPRVSVYVDACYDRAKVCPECNTQPMTPGAERCPWCAGTLADWSREMTVAALPGTENPS